MAEAIGSEATFSLDWSELGESDRQGAEWRNCRQAPGIGAAPSTAVKDQRLVERLSKGRSDR